MMKKFIIYVMGIINSYEPGLEEVGLIKNTKNGSLYFSTDLIDGLK